MLPNILIFFYELFHGSQDPVFRDEIYEPTGTVLMVSTLILLGIYYYGFNGIRAKFNKTWPHWGSFLIINMALNMLSVLFIAHRTNGVDLWGAPTLLLCLINAGYAAVCFCLASLIFKLGSPHASHTPI